MTVSPADASRFRVHERAEWHRLEAEQKAVVDGEAVLAHALLLEAEVARNRAALVVAAHEADVARVAHLGEREQTQSERAGGIVL